MEENQESHKSNRGGYRPGSGNKYKWRHGETKPVRIPITIADEVVELAKAIDSGKRLVPDDSVTQSADTKGSDEIARYQAELESLKALNSKLSDKVGGLEADLIKVHQQLRQTSNERDNYLDRISDIELELQNLKDDRVTQSRLDDNVTQSSQETTNAVREWCVFARHNDGKLQFMGGYGRKGEAETKAYQLEREHRFSEAIGDRGYIGSPPTYEIRELLVAPVGMTQKDSVTQSKVMGIDLEEFYDAVILKHPPRERKLLSKPMQKFKALIAEALTRRGVPVR